MGKTNYNKISTDAPATTAEVEAEAPIERITDVEEIVIVTAELLNVRKKPSLDSDIVKTVTKDTKLTVLGREKDFIKIEGGYVKSEFVK